MDVLLIIRSSAILIQACKGPQTFAPSSMVMCAVAHHRVTEEAITLHLWSIFQIIFLNEIIIFNKSSSPFLMFVCERWL